MSARFVVAAASPLRNAWSHIFNMLQVPSERISFGDQFQVSCDNEAAIPTTYQGVLPMLSALRSAVANGEAVTDDLCAFLGGSSVSTQSLVNQWAILATQIAAAAVDAAAAAAAAETADIQLSTTPCDYLASSPKATVADVLLYASLSDEVVRKYVRLNKWATFVASDKAIIPNERLTGAGSEATGASAGAGAGGSSVKSSGGGGGPAAKPSAEEIERRRLEKEKAKAEKELAKAAAAAAQPAATAAPAAPTGGKKAAVTNADTVDATDLDIRVGQIVTIARHPEADKLFVETVALGGEETRTIVSGLVEHYKAEQLEGQHVLVVCNLKPKPLKGVVSHGMVLCASNADGLKVVSPPEGTPAGTRVSFGGKLSASLPPIPSNAATIELLAHFTTNEAGVMAWRQQSASVPLGPVTSSLTNALVK